VALPTIELDWHCAVNNLQPSSSSSDHELVAREMLIAIKNRLKGGGSWVDLNGGAVVPNPSIFATVKGSATHAVAALDGVDRWTNAAAVPDYGWIVLVLPELGVELCWEKGLFGAPDYQLRVTMSAAGFSGGTTSSRPTAADEVTINAANDGWGAYGSGGFTNENAAYFNVWAAPDGTAFRVAITSSRGGSIGTSAVWLIERAGDPSPGWTVPVYALIDATPGSGDMPGSNSFSVSAGGRCKALKPGGGTMQVGHLIEGDVGGNAQSCNLLGDALDLAAYPPLWPVGLVCTESGARGRHGYARDLWWGRSTADTGDNLRTGDAYDGPALTQYRVVHFGRLVMPWPHTIAPLINPIGAQPARTIREGHIIGYASSADTTEPVVENVSVPAHKYDSAQFDVRDPAGALRAIVCLVGYDNEAIPSEVVHLDAGERVGFAARYTGTRTPIADGFRYRVTCAGGWPLLPTRFHALPLDTGGNLG
jgi:hypothetical protein